MLVHVSAKHDNFVRVQLFAGKLGATVYLRVTLIYMYTVMVASKGNNATNNNSIKNSFVSSFSLFHRMVPTQLLLECHSNAINLVVNSYLFIK